MTKTRLLLVLAMILIALGIPVDGIQGALLSFVGVALCVAVLVRLKAGRK